MSSIKTYGPACSSVNYGQCGMQRQKTSRSSPRSRSASGNRSRSRSGPRSRSRSGPRSRSRSGPRSKSRSGPRSRSKSGPRSRSGLRSRSSSISSGPKCMRPGRVTNNGYLNFLRYYRKNHCGLTAVQTVIEGAKEWNGLSQEGKAPYNAEACKLQKYCKLPAMARIRGRLTRSRRMGSSRRRSRATGRRSSTTRRRSRALTMRTKPTVTSDRKCMRPGPITRNNFFNYCRCYRQQHCGVSARDVIRCAARAWRAMSQEEKDKFRNMQE